MQEFNKMATATAEGEGARSPLLPAMHSSPGRWMGLVGLRLGTTRTFETLHQITQDNSQRKGSSPPAKPKLSSSGEIPAVTKETGDCWSDLHPRCLPVPPGSGVLAVEWHSTGLRCLLLETGTPLHPLSATTLARGSSAASSQLLAASPL